MLIVKIKKLNKKLFRILKNFYKFMIFVEEQRLISMKKSGRGWM